MSHQPQDLIHLSKAEQLLAQAVTIDDLKDIRDKAEAVRLYAKKIRISRSIILQAAVIKVKAERRMGEMLRTLPLANSALGNQYTGKLDGSHNATGPTVRLRELNISKSDSSRWQQIASLPATTFNRYVSERVASDEEPTTAGLLRLAKQQKANATVVADVALPARFFTDLQKIIATGQRFATIYADPPWKYDNQATRGATGNHYPTMTVEEIAALPIAELAAKNSHCHLWTTNAFLPAAFSVIERWGFSLKSCLLWVKPTLGIGNYWRVSHEFLLLGVRGRLPFRDKTQRSWIELERQGHSCKPEEIRALIEKVSSPPYLELFGRRVPDNPAWIVYGNQLAAGDHDPNPQR